MNGKQKRISELLLSIYQNLQKSYLWAKYLVISCGSQKKISLRGALGCGITWLYRQCLLSNQPRHDFSAMSTVVALPARQLELKVGKQSEDQPNKYETIDTHCDS